MKRDHRVGLHRLGAGALCIAIVLGAAPGARAEEPYRQFLDELYRRQMFDVALMYLDSLRNSPLVSDDVKATITYEEGVTLIEGAGYERDIPKRKRNLEQAREKLGTFVKEQPNHPLAGSARIQLGNILINRAQANLELAKVPSQAAKKTELLEEARKLFGEAEKICEAAEAKFLEQAKKFPKFIDPNDRQQIAARDQVKIDLIQTRLLSATAVYEHSKAYDKGASEPKALLTRAAEKFGKIFDLYPKLLAGLYARMYQGRCHVDQGDTKTALSIFGELLLQPDDPQEFRDLKADTLALCMQCWNSESEKKYDETINRGEVWVQGMRGNEDRTPEGLTIRWLISQAYSLRAAALADGDAQKPRDLKAALEHAGAVAKAPGEHQQAAREFVAKTRNVDANSEPTNFAEARTKGSTALDSLQVAINDVRAAAAEGGDAATLAPLQEKVDAARNDAVKYFKQALAMRQPDTPVEDVNQVRYYLCFLDYQEGRFYDAAVMGEFLARKYPQSSYSRKAAQLALASFLGAYNGASPNDRQFETDRMLSLALYTGETWPGELEADEAWLILGDLATRDGRIEEAAEYLKKIPPESVKRADADLKLGQALWTVYLRKSRLSPESQPSPEEMQKLQADAQSTLEAGVQKMRTQVAEGAALSFALLSAELSLAQIYVGSAQADKAIALVELSDNGLLALVVAKDPNLVRGNLEVETYKVALRAYVAAQQLEKAEKMMNALEGVVGANDAASLTRIYLGLGKELEEQVARLKQENKTEDLNNVLKGFELFLDRIAARDSGVTFNSLMWVAETFYRLGEGLDTGETASPEAQAYYAKAVKTYEQVLERSKQEGFAPNAESVNSVNVRMARCERRMGQYDAAVKRIVDVLKKKPNALEAQIEGAYTYQAWGAKDPQQYKTAMIGAQRMRKKDGSTFNLIWGWSKLSQTVQPRPEYQTLYFEARYNIAECYYRFAMTKQGKEKADALNQAQRAITVMARLDRGDFGGPEWFDKFDQLLRQIDRANGGKGDGLKQVIEALSQASADATK